MSPPRRSRLGRIAAIILGAFALLALAAPVAASASTAAPAAVTSHYSQFGLLAGNTGGEVWLSVTTSQGTADIWVDGKVSCINFGSKGLVTWCGIGAGNDSPSVQVGFNFTIESQKYYFRVWIPVAGPCAVSGDMTPVGTTCKH